MSYCGSSLVNESFGVGTGVGIDDIVPEPATPPSGRTKNGEFERLSGTEAHFFSSRKW